MVSDVKLPFGGTHPKNQVLLYGGAVAVVVAYALYKKRQNAATTAANATADPSQTDPATGYAYGSPQDAQALAAQSAYQSGTDYGGGGGPSTGTTSTGLPTGGGFTSNEQWKQAADAYLTGIGLDSIAISSALGKYLSGEFLNATEKNYVEQAIGSEGHPPVSGPNGYPPNIRVQASGGPAAKTQLAAPHLSATHKTRTGFLLSWAPVPHAAHYTVQHAGGAFVSRGTAKTSVTVPHGSYIVVAQNPRYFDSPASSITG